MAFGSHCGEKKLEFSHQNSALPMIFFKILQKLVLAEFLKPDLLEKLSEPSRAEPSFLTKSSSQNRAKPRLGSNTSYQSKGLRNLAIWDSQEWQETAHVKSYGVDTSPKCTKYIFPYENGSSLLIK